MGDAAAEAAPETMAEAIALAWALAGVKYAVCANMTGAV
jgi:hypothetical protein